MVCVRDLQVTQHKTKSTFKALECVLQVHDYLPDGSNHKRSATHACMKMDTLMPDMIGVPKAVLEHVVFCHQEESNWPLQEGAKLKERFDAIFEASRYTKALEDIRKVRKEQAVLAKDADNNAALQQVHVTTLSSLRQKIAQYESQRGLAEAEVVAEEDEIQVTEELVRAIKRQQEAVTEIRRQLEAASAHAKAANDNFEAIEIEIRRLPSVEATEVKRLRELSWKAFERESGNMEKNIYASEAQHSTTVNNLSKLREEEQNIGKEILRFTALLSDRIAARKAVISLESEFTSCAANVIREVAQISSSFLQSSSFTGSVPVGGTQLQSSGDSGTTLPLTLHSQGSGTSSSSSSSLSSINLNFSSPFTVTQAEGYISRLSTARTIASRELSAYRTKEGEIVKDAKRKATEASSTVTKLTAKQEGIQNELRRVRNDVQTTENDIAMLSNTSGRSSTGESDIQSIQMESSRITAELEQLMGSTHNVGETAQAVAKLSVDIETYGRAMGILRRIQSVLMNQSSIRAEIDVLRSTADDKEKRVRADLRAETYRIEQLIPHSAVLDPDKLDGVLQQYLNELHQQMKMAEAKVKYVEQIHDRATAESERLKRTMVEDLCTIKGILPKVQKDAVACFPLIHNDTITAGLREILQLNNESNTQASPVLEDTDETRLKSLPLTELLLYVPSSPMEKGFTTESWDMHFIPALRNAVKLQEASLTFRDNYISFLEDGMEFLKTENICQLCGRDVPGGAESEEGKSIIANIQASVEDEKKRSDVHGKDREAGIVTLAEIRHVLEWAEQVSPFVKDYENAYNRTRRMAEELQSLLSETVNSSRGIDDARLHLENLRSKEAETMSLLVIVTQAINTMNEVQLSRRRANEKENSISISAVTVTSGSDLNDLRYAEVTLFNDMNTAASLTLDSLARVILQLENKISETRTLSKELSAIGQERTKRQLALQVALTQVQTSLATAQAAETKLATVRGRLNDLHTRQYDLEIQLKESTTALGIVISEATTTANAAKQIEESYSSIVSNYERRFGTYDIAQYRCTGLLDRIKKARIEAGMDAIGSGTEMTTLVASSTGTNVADNETQLDELKRKQAKLQEEIKHFEQEVELSSKNLRMLSATKSVLSIVNRLHKANETQAQKKDEEAELRKKLVTILEEVSNNETLLSNPQNMFVSSRSSVSGNKRHYRNDDDDGDDGQGEDNDDGITHRRSTKSSTNIDLSGMDDDDGNGYDGSQHIKKKSRSHERISELSSASRSDDPLGTLDRQANMLEKLLADHLQAKARIDGRLEQLRISVESTRTEMKTKKELQNCEKRYKDAVIEATLLDTVVQDLDMYHKVLDTALMRFHKLKIAEINAVIRDLWTNTYHGADIDNIEIRSDLEEDNTGGSNIMTSTSSTTTTGAIKGSKSYNYRVVMQKGDAELDMRGRCSAGQKVLASIVIRLALAESFCVNTGILALDEPTTNLDPPNKKGLAGSLARLIELRAGSNLQLIVITHDEDFVRELGSAMEGGGGSNSVNQLGVYYRVSREEVLGRPGVYHSFIEHLEL